jgi:hypothetical protein
MSVLVLRQPMMLRIASAVLLSVFAFMLAVGALASGSVLAWFGPPAGLLGALGAVRNWRLGVVVSAEELVIANLSRTHHLDWTEVDRVVVDGGVRVRLRSGREVGITAFEAVPGAFPMVRSRNAKAAKQLEAAVKKYRRR